MTAKSGRDLTNQMHGSGKDPQERSETCAHQRLACAPHVELTPWRANDERFTLLPRLLPKPSRSDRSRRRRSAPEPLPRPPSQSVATRSVEQHSMVTKAGIDAVRAEKAAGEGPSLGRPNRRARMVTGVTPTMLGRSNCPDQGRGACRQRPLANDSRTFICWRRSARPAAPAMLRRIMISPLPSGAG